MIVIPVVTSNVNWEAYINTVVSATGRSPTRSLDTDREKVGTPSSFIASLAELKKENTPPWFVYHAPGDLLKHIHFSFLTDLDVESLLELSANLTILNTDELALVSGTLHQWDCTITSNWSSKKVRQFLTITMLLLEQLGCGQFWVKYKKVMQPDNTLRLEK